MRITFILPGYCLSPIGGAKVVYQYANQLVARGHEVNVVHPRYMRNLSLPLLRALVQVFRYYIGPRKRKWQAIDDNVKMLYVQDLTPGNVPDADAVIATAWQTAEYVRDYPAAKGKKYYLIQHYEIWSGPKERVDATWRGPFKKLMIAKWLYKKGIELGIPESDMFYVPNAIDHDVFRIIAPIEGRGKRIGMMFHKAVWKGCKDGIRAIEMMHDQFPEVTAILFGRDRRPKYLPGCIEYWRYPDQKELVEDIYNKISIFVCPSWTEGTPAPPAEAMACGCALVSTNCTGIDEYAENNVTALISPVKDPESMAKNLGFLIESDPLRVKIAKKGHEKIAQLQWGKSTDMLEKALNPARGD